MGITGYTDYKTFHRYVNVKEEKKRTEMVKAWGARELKKVIGAKGFYLH